MHSLSSCADAHMPYLTPLPHSLALSLMSSVKAVKRKSVHFIGLMNGITKHPQLSIYCISERERERERESDMTMMHGGVVIDEWR
jgi:hypothetical protein